VPIPMSGEQSTIAPPQARMLDTSIPLEVHAMSNVQGEKALPDSMDVMRGIETGQEIAQNQYKLKDQQLASQAKDQEAQDQATVKAWKATHPDKSFMHPEDIQLAMTELEGKVSQHSFEQLQTYHQATQEHSDKMSADLKKKSAEQVASELADIDHAAEHLFLPARESYIKSLAQQGTTPENATEPQKIEAQKEMKKTMEAASAIAAQSPLKDSKGQPLFNKERLAQYNALPDFASVDQHYQAADFAKRHYKESLDNRKEMADAAAKESKSSLEEAQAIAALRGPQDKSSEYEREVLALYPKGSPEYTKAMKDRMLKETHIAESEKADKNAPGTGFKETAKRFFRRVSAAGEHVNAVLGNIAKLPVTVDKGYFSSEHSGTTLFGSAISSLGTEMNSGDTKDYLTTVSGLRRGLANAEAQGMMPSGLLTHMMAPLEYTKGDTHIDKMRKLADARQVIEMSLKPWYNDESASPAEKKYIKSIADNLAKTIPWTVDEMTELRAASKDPKRKHQTPQQVFDEYRKHAPAKKNVLANDEAPESEPAKAAPKKEAAKKSEHPDDIQKLIDGAK
jgi:hypothetical protein